MNLSDEQQVILQRKLSLFSQHNLSGWMSIALDYCELDLDGNPTGRYRDSAFKRYYPALVRRGLLEVRGDTHYITFEGQEVLDADKEFEEMATAVFDELDVDLWQIYFPEQILAYHHYLETGVASYRYRRDGTPAQAFGG